MKQRFLSSALSLRVFGEDITFAGRNAAQKKSESSSVAQALMAATQADDDADSEMFDAGGEVNEDIS